MILSKFTEFLNNISNGANKILDKYGNNQFFWIALAFILFIIGCWTIRYLNKDK